MKKLIGAVLVAAVLAVGAARIVLSDGIWDGICATQEPGSALWVLYGCSLRPQG